MLPKTLITDMARAKSFFWREYFCQRKNVFRTACSYPIIKNYDLGSVIEALEEHKSAERGINNLMEFAVCISRLILELDSFKQLISSASRFGSRIKSDQKNRQVMK